MDENTTNGTTPVTDGDDVATTAPVEETTAPEATEEETPASE